MDIQWFENLLQIHPNISVMREKDGSFVIVANGGKPTEVKIHCLLLEHREAHERYLYINYYPSKSIRHPNTISFKNPHRVEMQGQGINHALALLVSSTLYGLLLFESWSLLEPAVRDAFHFNRYDMRVYDCKEQDAEDSLFQDLDLLRQYLAQIRIA